MSWQVSGEEAGQGLATCTHGGLTGHSEHVLLLLLDSASPRKEPGRHWVHAWWEEGPTSLPWPHVAQLALMVKALRNLPLPQATQELGPSAVELAGTKPPLQAMHVAMPLRGAKLLVLMVAHDLHACSSAATPLGVRVFVSQKDTVPMGQRSISVRARAPSLDFSL